MRRSSILLLLAVTACSSASRGTVTEQHTTVPTPAHTVGATPRHVTACKARALRVRGGRQGGGFGTAHADVEITNIGHAACRLGGPPSLMVISTNEGSQLPVGYRVSSDVAHNGLVLSALDGTSLDLSWSSWCGPALGPLEISAVLPHGTGMVTGPFNGPPDYNLVPDCAGRKSTLELIAGYE